MLICFSHLRWDFVFQRPQHLLSRAVRFFDVVFFEEPHCSETCRAHLDVRETAKGVTVVTPHLPSGLCGAEGAVTQRRLLNMLLETRRAKPAVAWYYTPMALQFSGHIPFPCVIYDCMDELSNFKNPPAGLKDLELELFARADAVFTGGQALFEAKKPFHSNIHAFPSSIDRGHFAKARSGGLPDPEDQKHIPHPRVGFFGVIDERTDLNLVAQAAALRPQCHFIMIGPVVKIDPAALPQATNIHWLGQKSYAALPGYLAHWDAGYMPFAINDATRFISPTKTPEFLAAGLPVVSTPITDVVRSWGRQGLVSIAASAESMCGEIDKVLAADKSLWLKRVDQALASTSWDMTFAAMLNEVQKILRSVGAERTKLLSAARAGDAHV